MPHEIHKRGANKTKNVTKENPRLIRGGESKDLELWRVYKQEWEKIFEGFGIVDPIVEACEGNQWGSNQVTLAAGRNFFGMPDGTYKGKGGYVRVQCEGRSFSDPITEADIVKARQLLFG